MILWLHLYSHHATTSEKKTLLIFDLYYFTFFLLLLNLDLHIHLQAKEAGSTRFCMGAAWRDTVGRKTNFKQILEYVKEIR